MLLKDGVRSHPKVLRAGAEAAWLWTCCIDYSRAQLTNGYVPTEALPTLANCRAKVTDLVDRLVAVGLLQRVDSGVEVHDYLKHNDSAEKVLADKAAAKKRQASHRDRKRGHAGGDGDVTDVSQRDSTITGASPRARVGVGVFVSTSPEGIGPERGSSKTVPIRPVAADYGEAWREAAHDVGTDLVLGFTGGESEHLHDMAQAYSLDEFTSAARVWWQSKNTGGRNLGLFRSQIAEVLGHIKSGAKYPFRGRPPLHATEPSRPALPKGDAIFAGERL